MITSEFERFDRDIGWLVTVRVKTSDEMAFQVVDNGNIVQDNITAIEVIRYLSNALHSVNMNYGRLLVDNM